MPEVIFRHEKIKTSPLVVDTGMDEIAWGYVLNTAQFATYGGEVIQILSTYLDHMQIQGTVRQYQDAEEIYEFFMQYFVVATQGSSPNATEKFEHTPMTMEYPERNWTFYVQPLKAPVFTYSLETVAPKWQVEAHVVDRGLLNKELKEFVIENAKNEQTTFGHFALKGLITPSAASADPETNPFIAPVTPTTNNPAGEPEFNPKKQDEVQKGLGKIADYYSKLLPSYMDGSQFEVLTAAIGSKPIFGRSSVSAGEEAPEELIKSTTGSGKKPPKTN